MLLTALEQHGIFVFAAKMHAKQIKKRC